MDDHMVAPHGGRLVDLRAGSERAAALRAQSRDWPSWDLTPRQLCDLEALVSGGFSPLRGFLGRSDYESVCDKGRLTSGALWPIPIVLDVSDELAESVTTGSFVALRDPEGTMLAALEVTELWKPDRQAEIEAVYGHGDVELLGATHPWYLGGSVEAVADPAHHDFRALRLTPAEVRAEFDRLGWRKVATYQTGGLMHRDQVEATLGACQQRGARLLIQARAGQVDADHYARVRGLQAVLAAYPPGTVMLSVLSLAVRPAGPREDLWQAIVAKNHGSSLVLTAPSARPPAEGLLELGVEVVRLPAPTLSVSDHELGRIIADGGEVPDGFTYPAVVAELRRRHPRRDQQGFTVFFTGLSGSGKSTIANVLMAKLLEGGERPVTLLDGDVVRRHLSSELGFSRQHRDINIRRIGFVASEITKNGGIAICAPIAPYRAVREEVRGMIESVGGFVLVALDTSLEVCEARDRKGLYAKARAGILKEFTGISDPYESPTDAEVVIDTARLTPEAAADEIIGYLDRQGFFPRGGGEVPGMPRTARSQ